MTGILNKIGVLIARCPGKVSRSEEFYSFSSLTGELRPRGGYAIARTLRMAMAILLFMAYSVSLQAQNLINTGQINNTGTLRVKNQATGLPPVVDGAFEYFGSNQTVLPVQYKILRLSGSGTKASASGNFTVTDSVILASGVLFRVDSSSVLMLDGTLDENGYLLGKIQKTVNLAGGTTSSPFGNIGSTISWTGIEPGSTTVLRASGIVSTGNGNQSIKRYYDINPATNSGLNANLTLSYANNELNGHDSTYLQLWKSDDGGTTWQYAVSVANPAGNTVTGSGISSFSRWTLSDTANYPLGSVMTSARIILKHFVDSDGNIGTALDRYVAPWNMIIRQDSLTGPIVATTASDTMLDFTSPTGGTFYLIEPDSIGWTRLGYQNGITPAVSSSANYFSISVAPSQTTVARFYTFKYGSISGMKFNDANANGVKDISESGLSGWRIRLAKNGLPFDSALTAGDGSYSFANLNFGTYTLTEAEQSGWIRTMPSPSGSYSINLQSGQNLTGKDFGNYLFGSIAGTVYEDANTNSIKDVGEAGIANWRVRLIKLGTQVDSVLTDANGAFIFDTLYPGTYTLRQEVQSGWIALAPMAGEHAGISIASGENHTGYNFGNYRTGIISGTLFYDVNGNGVQDGAESGLTGWTINADASIPTNSRTTTTTSGGAYAFVGLNPDDYVLSLTVEPNWTLTAPVSITHNVTLPSGNIIVGKDFGATTVLDSFSFRTFTVENLAVQKPVSRLKCNGFDFAFDFVNNTGRTANGIYVEFANIVSDFTEYSPFTEVEDLGVNAQDYKFLGGEVAAGETVHVQGFSVIEPCRIRISKWWWLSDNVNISRRRSEGPLKPVEFMKRSPMPNGANVRDEAFTRGFILTGGLKLGIVRKDKAKQYGWVKLLKSMDLYRSLLDRGSMHDGSPRGFTIFSNNGKFVGEQKTLTPARHNNRLFAELATLKVNIEASSRGITPPGLSELVYEEASNPLSGFSIREIALRADSMMTYWSTEPISRFMNLDTTVRKINNSFAGPMDTVSFVSQLEVKAAKSLSIVPFLRLPSDITPIIQQRLHAHDEYKPEGYALYQNYPNPFNPSTTIEFALPFPSMVTLKVYDVLGQEVGSILVNEMMETGMQQVEFTAQGISSGIYFYKVVAERINDDERTGETFIDIKKMTYVR